jgi:hypothetical protein
MTTDEQWLDRAGRVGTAQIAALFGAFFSAVGLGWGLAYVVAPGSEVANGIGTLALIAVLVVGYKAWIAYLTTLVAKGLFGGFFRALIRFVFSREKKDADAAMTNLKSSLGDPERARDLVQKMRKKASVFRWLGVVFGFLAGGFVGLFNSQAGLITTLLLYAAAGFVFGTTLTWLGRDGYLPLPGEIEL